MDYKVPQFTTVSRHLHSVLKLNPEEIKMHIADNKMDKLLTETEDGNLRASIERMYEQLMKTDKSEKRDDILEGSEKLYNGGHVSYDQ